MLKTWAYENWVLKARAYENWVLKAWAYSSDKNKKILMVTWDDSNSEKSNSLDDEQAKICLMVDTNNKSWGKNL